MAINYFTKTFITDIWQDRKSVSTFFFKKVLFLNFRGLFTSQYSCFFINIMGVLGILEWQKKSRKATKNEICNSNADLPCLWLRICWKTCFRLCISKVETKNKISTCYTKNIDRILKCLDKLRSNFYKLVNLRLTLNTFGNPGFMTLNLKIIFQNCWHSLTNPIFLQFTVNTYQFTDPSQPPLVDMCEGLPT